MKKLQTTIRLTPSDMDCIERLKRDYGITSTQAAIRLALRLGQLERFPAQAPQLPPEKK